MADVLIVPKPRNRLSIVLLIVGIVGVVAAAAFVIYSAISNSQPAPSVPLAPLPVTILNNQNGNIGSGYILICGTNPLNLGERGQITVAFVEDVKTAPACTPPLVAPPNVLFTQTQGAISVYESPQVSVSVVPVGTFSITPATSQPIVGAATWVIVPNAVSDLDYNNFSIQIPAKAALPRRPWVDLTLSISFTVEVRRNLFQQIQQYVASAQGLLVSIGGIASAILAIVGLIERVRKNQEKH